MCAHRSAWSSPLTPRSPCHGMHTLAARPAPPCLDLVVREPRQGTNTKLRAQGRLCLGEYKLEIITQCRAAEDEMTRLIGVYTMPSCDVLVSSPLLYIVLLCTRSSRYPALGIFFVGGASRLRQPCAVFRFRVCTLHGISALELLAPCWYLGGALVQQGPSMGGLASLPVCIPWQGFLGVS